MSEANATRFISNEKLEWLIRDLQDLPEQCQRAKQKAEGYTIPGEDSLKYIESEVMGEVYLEMNDKGKPKFSNREMREAEVQRRLVGHEEYQHGKKENAEAKKVKGDLYTDVYLLRDQLKAKIALAGLLASLIDVEAQSERKVQCLTKTS